LILERVGADLVGQAQTTPLMPAEIDQRAAVAFGDLLQTGMESSAAISTH
jgi:hypothetical protein